MASTFILPTEDGTWLSQAAEHGIARDASIHEYQCNSASRVGNEQFLLLRVLWRREKKVHPSDKHKPWHAYISTAHFEHASNFLKGLPCWEKYLDSTTQSRAQLNSIGFAGLETFSLVRHQQLAAQGAKDGTSFSAKVDFTPVAMRTRGRTNPSALRPPTTPTKSTNSNIDRTAALFNDLGLEEPDLEIVSSASDEPSTAPTPVSPWTGNGNEVFQAIEDEQMVNTALWLYLHGIIIHCKDVHGDWSLHRRAFIARNASGGKTYEARVDGVLQTRNNNKPVAILEVKPFTRDYGDKMRDIRIQEGAQMAAWISQHPPDNLEKMRQSGEKDT
jgi:hypothetical protein